MKNSVDEQMEAIRHQYQRPKFSLLPKQLSSLLNLVKFPMKNASQRLLEQEYEMAWARLFSCRYVLEQLQAWRSDESIPDTVAVGVAKIWQGGLDSCEAKIVKIEKQYPVVSAGIQRKLIKNFLRTAQAEHLSNTSTSNLYWKPMPSVSKNCWQRWKADNNV